MNPATATMANQAERKTGTGPRAKGRSRRPAGGNAPMRTADYQRLASFRFALRGFLHFSDAAAARLGVTGPQYQALLFVRSRAEGPPVAIRDLAQELLIRHNSAVGLVDRLAAQRLMERRQVAEDRRKVQLVLTRRGEQVLGRLAQLHRRELAKIGPEIHRILGELASAWLRSG